MTTAPSSEAALAETPSRSAPVRWWIPAALLAAFALQSLWFIGTQSLTYDEPGHIIAGLEAWQHGRFEMWTDHPPLGRYWLTLPIAAAHVEITQEQLPRGYRVTAMQPGPEWLAWHTRPMNTLLGIALGVTLWFAARRLFSEGAANVALALFAFTPSLIAHFSVTTTDGVGTLFVFLAAYQFVRWRRKSGRNQTILMGLVLGGLLLAKHYTPPEFLLALALMLLIPRDCRQRSRLNWGPALTAFLIALFVFWAGYLFHVSHLTVGHGQVVASFPNRPTKIRPTKITVQLNLLIPAGEYVEGLRDLAINNRQGRAAWLLGKVYPTGRTKFYYPVAIALKWPIILLLLLLVRLLLGIRKICKQPGDLLKQLGSLLRRPRDVLKQLGDLPIMCSFGLVFLFFALQSRINIGERHILPLYPFALLIAGGIWEHARKRRVAAIALILALCLNAADALRYAPDYLAYFNILVRPQTSWRLLTDSNLDWGQGLIALRNYERQHPSESLHLAYFGSVDPSLYGIRALPLAPNDQVKGTVVASATCLSGQLLDDPQGYRWLGSHHLERIIDHSMWVFDTR